MADPFIGQIMAFAGNYAPSGWLFCQGQLLSISQYNTLYAVLGTYYGGDGVNNFALPNLQGRTILGVGQGTGLTNRAIGTVGGTQNVTLTTQQMATHSHQLAAQGTAGTAQSPSGNVQAVTAPGGAADLSYAAANAASPVSMAPGMINATGSAQPISTTSPFTCINYIIAYEGIYPSQS